MDFNLVFYILGSVCERDEKLQQVGVNNDWDSSAALSRKL